MILPTTQEVPIEPLYQTAIVETIEIATPKQTPEEPQITPEDKLKQDIKNNINNCNTDTHWISAEDASCLPKRTQTVNVSTQRQNTARGAVNTPGNTYSYGYCTHYVKEQLPWVPNGLGNAVEWINGLSSTANPKVGMVAWQGGWVGGGYGHVAVVTAVNGDAVTVSEKNYAGWNIVSTRTVHVSEFTYLY